MKRSTIAIVALVLIASPNWADTPVLPYSYSVVSPDGGFVFVMIPTGDPEKELHQFNDEWRAKIRKVRETYKRSGMYRNDGSTAPLWTVDWYALGVVITSDGKHVVRRGPWASALNDEAVSFFADGKLLREYKIRELVDNPLMLRRSVSHFLWEESARLDDQRMEYVLTTLDGNAFVFDIRSGEIISSFRPIRVLLWVAAAIAVVGLLIWFIWRRRKRSLAVPAHSNNATG